MPQSRTLYVGMDVPQDSIAVASGANDPDAEGVALGTSGTQPWDIAHLIRRLPSNSPPLVFV
jgi:hypothetical protein